VAKRILSSGRRIRRLQEIVKKDMISLPENIERLKGEIYELTHDLSFKKSGNMGEILSFGLDFVKRNYQDMGMQQIFNSGQ